MSVHDKKVIVVIEIEDGKTAFFTYELLRAGKELADSIGTRFGCVVLGHEIEPVSEEMVYYADEVYVIDHPLLHIFQTDLYSSALTQLVKGIDTDTVILGHTLENTDLAPRIAWSTGAQLITDAIHIEADHEGRVMCDKPVYGDKAVATFSLDKTPRMVTLRPKVMVPLEKGMDRGVIMTFPVTLDESMVKIEFIEAIPGERVSLDKADAIVAGGRGIKEIKGLSFLEDLAKTLKGFYSTVEIGASRPLVDSGFLPHSRQVGLTGEKVAPELYVAVAISGASQHLSGMTGSKKIVAINKDDQATIFEAADYGVVGDYEKVIPSFIRKLKELS